MAKGTVTQKILASHIVEGKQTVNSDISIRIDQTLTQDATGTMAYLELEAMAVDRVKTQLSVSYVDHNTQQNGSENNNDHMYLQTVAASQGLYFSRPGNGICHQVHLERFGVPGKTLLGSDSHTPTNGGIGMLSIGAGGLDVALAMAGKPFRLSYPKIIGVKLSGKFKGFVSAKDVILKVLETLTTKGNVGCVIEYFGDGIKGLSVPERATITNMGAELGVTTSIFPSDQNTRKFLAAEGRSECWIEFLADEDAQYDKVIEIDLDTLEPLAACPSSPDLIKKVKELKGTKVNQVIIGSCTNSSYLDICLVSKMLEGRTVHHEVSLSVAPGSKQVFEMAARNGLLAPIIAAGARILESACGPCIGQGMSPADDCVSLRTFNRNFSGRTGTRNDKAYLVSPAVATASALTGMITTPDELGFVRPVLELPEKFMINDNMIIPPIPVEESKKVKIIRKPTLGAPPHNSALPSTIEGRVLIKVGSKITTDHIMPAGKHLKLRSNIPAYSKVVFECFNKDGELSFAEKAEALKKSGKHGIIVAEESYGQGSSREHAAICPMYLGIKAVIALSMERIHTANLINFGIVPLFFNGKKDYERIEENDSIVIKNIDTQLRLGNNIKGTHLKSGGQSGEIVFKHFLNKENVEIIIAGGVLNMK
ncbi:MAG TPA: aconitate hydratase [Lentisphaeria bacterium]|nr:MAG: aconitate hydratase [Lentisphaerae bacterium GWF2_38_69]HBM15219.1 aconitate hydratase [Lentisphaeria bacterium]